MVLHLSMFFFCRSEAISLIEQQTGIGRNSQLILQQEALWKDVGKYPSTSIDNPLYLFNRENNNVQYVKETGIRKTSNLFFAYSLNYGF